MESFPAAQLPSALTRLGSELVFRDGAQGNFRIASLNEGDTTPLVAVDSPDLPFFVGSGAWRGRFVFGSDALGLAGTDGSPGSFQGLIAPAALADLQELSGLVVAAENLFVSALVVDGAGGVQDDYELWAFEGESGVPTRITFPSADLPPFPKVSFGDRLFFAQVDANNVAQPWISDGTVAGTLQLADFGSGSGGVDALVAPLSDGERVWFRARTPGAGAELWSTDGTVVGTQMVPELVPGAVGTKPTNLARVGDRIAFGAEVAGKFGVWSAPIAGGPAEQVPGLPAAAVPVRTRTFDGPPGVLLLNAPGIFPADVLWIWEGPGLGARPLAGPPELTAIGSEFIEVATDGTLLFSGATQTSGFELFRLGGAAMEPELIADVWPGAASSSPASITLTGERVLFSSNTASGRSLFAVSSADLGLSSMHPIGVGCEGAAELAGVGLPAPGASVALTLKGGAPGAIGALLFGRDLLPAPAIGICSVGVDATQVRAVQTLDGSGAANLPVSMPAVPALSGLVFRVQNFEFAPGGPLLGTYRSSNVLELVLGS